MARAITASATRPPRFTSSSARPVGSGRAGEREEPLARPRSGPSRSGRGARAPAPARAEARRAAPGRRGVSSQATTTGTGACCVGPVIARNLSRRPSLAWRRSEARAQARPPRSPGRDVLGGGVRSRSSPGVSSPRAPGSALAPARDGALELAQIEQPPVARRQGRDPGPLRDRRARSPPPGRARAACRGGSAPRAAAGSRATSNSASSAPRWRYLRSRPCSRVVFTTRRSVPA